MSHRLTLPNRRNHITQKVRIAGQRTLYLSVHDDADPAEVFLRVKGPDCTPELIGLYDVIARLLSIALQYGAPPEKLGDLLAGVKFEPCGAVIGHDRLTHRSSVPNLIGRHLLVDYCHRDELAHVPASVLEGETRNTANWNHLSDWLLEMSLLQKNIKCTGIGTKKNRVFG